MAIEPSPPPIDLPPSFDPITFGAEIIGTFLAAVFAAIFGGGPSAQQLQSEINTLASNLGQAVDTVKRFAWTVATGLGAALNALWQHVQCLSKKIWDYVKKLAEDFVTLVTKALPNIMSAIRKIRQVMRDIYKNWIGPLLAWIQLARKYLAILKLFHVKWAGAADKWLVTLQTRIIGPYLYVLSAINGVANWVNVILTAGAILQRPVFINTMFAYQQDWINMWWQAQQAGPPASTLPGAPPSTPPPTPAQSTAEFQQYVQSDTGPIADQAAAALTAFQQTIATA